MKYFISFVIAVWLALSTSLVYEAKAEENTNERFSGQLVIKNDWYKPEGKPGFNNQGLYAYFHYKWFGAGVDQWGGERSNYYEVRPFITVNKGPYYAVAGYAANSRGTGHVHFGTCYRKQIREYNVFLDLRQFIGIKVGSGDYLDFYASVTRQIGKRFYAGIEGEVIQWWGRNSDRNWSFVGPVGGLKLSNNLTLFVRPGVSFDNSRAGFSRTFWLRTGLVINF